MTKKLPFTKNKIKLRMVYVHRKRGKTYKELADMFEVSPSTVRQGFLKQQRIETKTKAKNKSKATKSVEDERHESTTTTTTMKPLVHPFPKENPFERLARMFRELF